MKHSLEKLLQKKYFLLMTRLHHPKEKVLEFLPILVAKAVLLIYAELIKGSVDEIFGILGYSNESPLFVYQFVIKMFNGNMELPLSTVDKIVSQALCVEKQQDWQVVIYQANQRFKKKDKQSRVPISMQASVSATNNDSTL